MSEKGSLKIETIKSFAVNMILLKKKVQFGFPSFMKHQYDECEICKIFQVHIPTNVYDRYQHLAETIFWSENLDEIFLKNYQADPSLNWQYFGSSFGMMRQFPGLYMKLFTFQIS